MITQEYTVTCLRGGFSRGNEADLESDPYRINRMGQPVSGLEGRITVTGPAADELKLGQKIKVILETVA